MKRAGVNWRPGMQPLIRQSKLVTSRQTVRRCLRRWSRPSWIRRATRSNLYSWTTTVILRSRAAHQRVRKRRRCTHTRLIDITLGSRLPACRVVARSRIATGSRRRLRIPPNSIWYDEVTLFKNSATRRRRATMTDKHLAVSSSICHSIPGRKQSTPWRWLARDTLLAAMEPHPDHTASITLVETSATTSQNTDDH